MKKKIAAVGIAVTMAITGTGIANACILDWIHPPTSPGESAPAHGAERTFTSDAGRHGNYIVYNEDAPAENGLLVWMHGDGQFEYNNRESKEYLGSSDGIVAQANAKDMKLIVPEAPSGDGVWWEDGERM